MGQLDKYQSDFILMCEAGFIAVNQLDEDSALKLFKASKILKPENTLATVGLGYLYLMQLKLNQAVEQFEAVLKQEPSNEMAKTFLGLTLSFTPNEVAKGEKMLEETAKSGQDPEIKSLATNAIDFIEKFVKKASSLMPPTTGKTEKKKKEK